MTLAPGRRLGPYEVVAPLGAGGMGEVYRARDTRLGRDVAVKVLPRALAADPARRARFEREARAISALNHPNVCALYDVGAADSPDGPVEFLVMELLQGETLAERVARGPLPAALATTVAVQVAQALGAAHRRGLVHRDLKPGNVMLTAAGAKLLDFGLARLDASTAADAEAATLATVSQPLTRQGTILGTWPYLAPEQLRGQPADARSDVFALGAVLYEMLTGRRAFAGATTAEVSAAILASAVPDPREHVKTIPAPLAAVVRQCLEKEPLARWQNADDVALALRLVSETPAGEASAVAVRAARRGWLWPAIAGALGLLALAALAGLWVPRRPAPAEPLRFVIPPPRGALMARPTTSPVVAASPDGRHIAFVAISGGVASLWLWSAREGDARRLEGTEGAGGPFFSPDGREVAFFVADELRRIAVDGGPATTIAPAPSGLAGTWTADGTILFVRWIGPEAGLWRVSSAGGSPVGLVSAARRSELRAFPSFLPAGQHYLFTRGAFGNRVGDRQVCVASIDGGEPSCTGGCDSQAIYARGRLLCVAQGTLVERGFDAARPGADGPAAPLASDVRWFGPTGVAVFAASADGRLLAHAPAPAPSRLVWLDRRGRELVSLGEPDRFALLELTRDGRRVGIEIWSEKTGGRDLWSLDTGSGFRTRLTFEPADASSIVWSPDGRRVAYAAPSDGPPDITIRDLEAGTSTVLLRAPGVQMPRHWSPDGRLLVYEDYLTSRRDQRQLGLVTLDGQRRRFHEVPASVYHPRFSPEGRRLAFVSEESGHPEVYVAPVEGPGPAVRLSRSGGLLPRWRADGRELFFFQPDGMMVSIDPSTEAPPPTLLFHVDGVIATDFDYDVAPDGQRFLVRLAPQPEGSEGLRVLLGRLDADGAAAR